MKTSKAFKGVALGVLGFLLSILVACDVGAKPQDFAEAELFTQDGDYVCRRSVSNITIDSNVVVPSQATCTLTHVTVKGTVMVSTGASLVARGVNVEGNIQAEGHQRVVVQKTTQRVSSVGGSIQIKQGGSAVVTDARLGGSLQLEQNNGTFSLLRNRINADLQAFSNTGSGLSITRNVINGNLQCKSNTPAPVGSSNQATSKQDQCANL